jgi:3-oxoacyl-[acyl-carrier protein] reductase
MELGLKGKRVLVTGGSRGIGRSIALEFARAGASLVIGHRQSGEAVDSLERELKEIGASYRMVAADLSRADEVGAVTDAARDHLGGLDVLVNNAGAISHIPYADVEQAEWERVLSTNLTAVFLLTQKALPLLGPGASVINMGSRLARVGLPGAAPYVASKAGLEGLTRSLAKELGPRGIRVNVVAPGIIETEQVADPEKAAALRERYSRLTSLGRLGQTPDVAGVVLFLASDISGYVTGEVLTVDGGI